MLVQIEAPSTFQSVRVKVDSWTAKSYFFHNSKSEFRASGLVPVDGERLVKTIFIKVNRIFMFS